MYSNARNVDLSSLTIQVDEREIMEDYTGEVISDNVIETPDSTTAKYVYTDHVGNRIYYDGIVYWVVDKISGLIDYYN